MNEGHDLKQAIQTELPKEEAEAFFKNPLDFSTHKYSLEQRDLLEKYQHWDKERIKANL